MNTLKKLSVAVLALVMILSAAACHPKDEVAVTIGEVDFTSAYYMCALINADSEAKSKVQEDLDEDESTTDIDYYSKKIDKKDYVEWVEDTAIDNLKQIAAYKILCKENKLEIPEEDLTNAESYASYYWTSYGYSAYFEPNGVGQNTYTQYMKDSYYASVYFEHLYGENGKKAIDAETVKTKLYDNFIIANMLQADFSDKEDTEITELKTTFNNYVNDLKSGKKTFEQVYKDYNGTTEETTETEDTSDEPKPKDEYASILGAKDTVYEADQYDAVKAMATGEIKLIELEDDAGLVIAVKQDIKADPYYLDSLDMTVRHLIKDDEFEKDIKAYADKLELKKNNYAIKQFKVKKIKEPEVTA